MPNKIKRASTLRNKLLLAGIFLLLSAVGLMVKLPVPFRGIDKEMHFAFYFGAAGLLNLLFARNNLLLHIFIFVFLYAFGMVIEYAQSYSNQFFSTRIHGNYDPEDVVFNLRGLVAFSTLWVTGSALYRIYTYLTGTSGPKA